MDSLAEEAGDPEPGIPAPLVTQLEGLTARERELQAAGDPRLPAFRAQRQAIQRQVDSIRVARRKWREQTFADFDSLADARQAELGATAAVDTTDAQGVARVSAEGRVWVWATYVLPDVTLEWNLPVTVRGDSAVVELTRQNAKERKFY
jgi:hypothetical protein